MSPTGDGFFLARLERTATCTARSTNHPRRAKLLGIARSRVRRNIFACSSFSAFLFTLQSEICGFPSGATLFFRRFRRVIRRIFASACASLLLSVSLSLSQRLAGHGRGGVLTLPTKATKNSRVTTGIAFIS